MYNVTANDGNVSYGVKEFVCDTVNDLNFLPSCEMGSSAFIIATSDLYMLNGFKEWVKV